MAKAKEQEQTYPRTLLWEEDAEDLGDHRRVSGRFVGIDEAPTKNGLKPILVLEIDGEERSVWVLHGPFLSKLTEELERRPNGEFTPGELIVIEQAKEKKIAEASGRPYTALQGLVPRAAAALAEGHSRRPEGGERCHGGRGRSRKGRRGQWRRTGTSPSRSAQRAALDILRGRPRRRRRKPTAAELANERRVFDELAELMEAGVLVDRS